MRNFLFPIVLLTTACALPAPGTEPIDAKATNGRLLVRTHCGDCHAIGRRDVSKHPDAPPLRVLSQNYPVTALEESLAEGIVVGHPDMPEFRFRSDDIAAIISYLESIQQF